MVVPRVFFVTTGPTRTDLMGTTGWTDQTHVTTLEKRLIRHDDGVYPILLWEGSEDSHTVVSLPYLP